MERRAKRGSSRLGPGRAVAGIAILLYVATLNFPGVLFENRRPSRLGYLAASLVLLTAALLVAVRIALRDHYAEL